MPILECAPRQRCGTCGKFLERGKGCPVHDYGLASDETLAVGVTA